MSLWNAKYPKFQGPIKVRINEGLGNEIVPNTEALDAAYVKIQARPAW